MTRGLLPAVARSSSRCQPSAFSSSPTTATPSSSSGTRPGPGAAPLHHPTSRGTPVQVAPEMFILSPRDAVHPLQVEEDPSSTTLAPRPDDEELHWWLD